MNPDKIGMPADTDLSPDKRKAREYIDRFTKGVLDAADLTPEQLGDSYAEVIAGLIDQIPPKYRGENWPPELVSDMWNPAVPIDGDEAEKQQTIRAIALQAYTTRWNAVGHTSGEITEGSTQIQPPTLETTQTPINIDELPEPSIKTADEKPDTTTSEELATATDTNIPLETTSSSPETVDLHTAETIPEVPQDQTIEISESPQAQVQNQERDIPTAEEEQRREIRAFGQGLEHFCKIIDGRERQGFSTHFIQREALKQIYAESQKFTQALEAKDIVLAGETLNSILGTFNTFGRLPNRSSAVNENVRSLEELKNNLRNTHISLGSIYRTYTKNNETNEFNTLLETINRFGDRLDRAHDLVDRLEKAGRTVLRSY